MSTSIFGNSEIEDFKKTLEKYGYSEVDFKIEGNIAPSPGAGIIYPLMGEVVVTHIPSGTTRSYKAGHDTTWPIEFANDLQSGVFK
jgi:hypothetical protein